MIEFAGKEETKQRPIQLERVGQTNPQSIDCRSIYTLDQESTDVLDSCHVTLSRELGEIWLSIAIW